MVETGAPGVRIRQVLAQPARVLRTGVPVFLGLISCAEFDAYNLRQTDEDKKLITVPPGSQSKSDRVAIVRKQGYVRLPGRIDSPAAALRSASPETPDPSFYLQAGLASGAQDGETSPKPQRFTTWSQFYTTYGDLKPYDGFLAHAVRGFFENDGRLCYVQLLRYANTNDEVLEAGLKSLEAYDDYDLVCVPDLWRGWNAGQKPVDLSYVQASVLAHCQRLGDRMAILDSLPGADTEAVLDQRCRLRGDNGALYFSWVRVANGPRRTEGFVPPCGHVAGIYARCDQRVGVHKAPANETVSGVLDLHARLDDRQQAPLNDKGINCIRAFPGRGIRVWGARTLSEQDAWRYVSARRVILTAARWIERTMGDVVFEPHTPRLWDRIVRDLTANLTDLVQRGALHSPPGGEAFYVKCDAETNPPERRDRGEIVTEIGLWPAAPAEFIVLRVVHGPTGVEIVEPGVGINNRNL